ncbi:MAG: hypothetical protein AAFV19_15075 [Pseudomonadota bacterium]
MPDGDSIFGVIANVAEDETLRLGAKVWIVDHNSGNAADRVFVEGLNIQGRTIKKWIASENLSNARAAWVPDHLRDTVLCRNGRGDAETIASRIAVFTKQESDADTSH